MAEDLHKQIQIDADVSERYLTNCLELSNKDAICLPSFLCMHVRLFLLRIFISIKTLSWPTFDLKLLTSYVFKKTLKEGSNRSSYLSGSV